MNQDQNNSSNTFSSGANPSSFNQSTPLPSPTSTNNLDTATALPSSNEPLSSPTAGSVMSSSDSMSQQDLGSPMGPGFSSHQSESQSSADFGSPLGSNTFVGSQPTNTPGSAQPISGGFDLTGGTSSQPGSMSAEEGGSSFSSPFENTQDQSTGSSINMSTASSDAQSSLSSPFNTPQSSSVPSDFGALAASSDNSVGSSLGSTPSVPGSSNQPTSSPTNLSGTGTFGHDLGSSSSSALDQERNNPTDVSSLMGSLGGSPNAWDNSSYNTSSSSGVPVNLNTEQQNPSSSSPSQQEMPTDLSHLMNTSNVAAQTSSPTVEQPQAQNLVVPETPAPHPTSLTNDDGVGIPKWLIFAGVGIVLLVAIASGYFILGIGKAPSSSSNTSLPVERQLTEPPSNIVPPQSTSSSPSASVDERIATDSGNTSEATQSAVDQIRNRGL